MKINSIVVAVDGSEHAGNAVRAAAELADTIGCDLKLLHVHSHTELTTTLAGTIDPQELDRLREENTRAVFDTALEQLGERRSSPEEIALMGDPAMKIIEYMKNHPDIHMVMGKRGLSKIQHLLLGSVSDKVVRYAPGVITVVGD